MVRRGSTTGTAWVALLAAFLLLCSAVSPAAAATDVSETPRPATCFPSGGYEFVIGTEGPQIHFILHLSLLPAVIQGDSPTNVSTTNTSVATETTVAAGAFGIEALAMTETDEVLSLQSGVLFDGVENATAFLSNPFAVFSYVFDYRLTIPAFKGTIADADYRESDVPVQGPVEEAACSQ